jgi:hypothetical protein
MNNIYFDCGARRGEPDTKEKEKVVLKSRRSCFLIGMQPPSKI